jgi:hypothetical protein
MTMQIGMIGTDGILLASDTKWMNTGDVRQTSSSSKILFNQERTVAVTCARNMENAMRIAQGVFDQIKTDADWLYPISKIEEIARQVLGERKRGDRERNDAQCLIFSLPPRPQLFSLEVALVNRLEEKPICRTIKDKAVVGDKVNAAVFWTERYYERKPIRSLIPLAAHLVISAGKLNPAGIGGLEIVLCESSGIHRLSDFCIRDLEENANDLDRSFGLSLASYAKALTYTPDVIG